MAANVKVKTQRIIQHRSDILLDEQLCSIKQVHDELQSVLQDIEAATSMQLTEILRSRAEDLKAKSQKLMLALQVMVKIKSELTHARADLNTALNTGTGDINEARKRVIWLEDKMKELSSRQKMENTDNLRSYDKEIKEYEEKEEVIDSAGKLAKMTLLPNEDGTDKMMLSYHEKQTDKVVPSHHEAKIDKVVTPHNEEGIEEVILSHKEKPADEISSLHEDKKENCQLRSAYADVESRELKLTYRSGEEENDLGKKSEDEVRNTHMADEYAESKDESEKIEADDDETKENERKNKDGHIFMTEVKGGETTADKDLDSKAPQIRREITGTEYRQSDQQKFEYSEYAHVLTEIDPLSYHHLGIAVLESFIRKDETATGFCELPWRERRKRNTMKDIQRVALDRLALRIHSLYDQVYDAAVMSVKSKQEEAAVSLEWMSQRPLTSESLDPASETDVTSDRKKTKSKLHQSPGEEIQGRQSRAKEHLTFYPKPIPAPQILPITRTNTKKQLPLFASSFCKPGRDVGIPAKRVVEQRNLLDETKLVLYREKINHKTSTVHMAKPKKTIQPSVEESRMSGRLTETRSNTRLIMTELEADGEKDLASLDNIKPQSGRNDSSRLRWKRIKSLVHVSLQSQSVEDRIDGARQLGSLGCGDLLVSSSLKDRLHHDLDERVRCEATKSLILIGCWETGVIENILKYLVSGNDEMRLELIEVLSHGRNIQLLDKTMPSFLDLVKVLSHFCCRPDLEDPVAFSAAVTLSLLYVDDERARDRLLASVQKSANVHVKARALEVLVKHMHYIDNGIINQVLSLLHDSPIWKNRFLACQVLASCGPEHECINRHLEKIYLQLEQCLWDDPSSDVKVAAAEALRALGLFNRACEHAVRKLKSIKEEDRAHAAIAVGILGMKSKRVIDLLLEMLKLDTSEHVRVMVIRTFGILKLKDHEVLHCLKIRDKLGGALARESRKVLKILDQSPAVQVSRLS